MTVTINGTTGLATDSTSAVVEAVSLNHPSSSTAAITMDASNNVTVNGAFTSQGIDDNATSIALTLDSSGNLLVGKTAQDLDTNGFEARIGGTTIATVDNSPPLYVNRKSSNGTIIDIRKDGSTVGIISTDGRLIIYDSLAGGIRFGATATNVMQLTPTSNTGTNLDNTHDIGASSVRWDDIYATNGTIQTSDRNEKQDIEELSEAEKRVATAAKGLIRKFRWIDSVAERGDDARIHVGVIAQDLQAAFEAEGLDAGRYAMFISSTWWEATETYTDDDGVEQTRVNTYETAEEAPENAVERTRLGVRYPELLAFIIGAL